MHDIEVVHVVEGQQELLDDVRCVSFREFPPVFNHVEKVATRDQLHDDVVAAIVFHQFEDSCDVGMHRLLQRSKLISVQLLEQFVFLQASLSDDFDGAGYLGLLVLTKFDRAKGASA